MKWSQPGLALRLIARKHGTVYSISPAERGWALRAHADEFKVETLFFGSLSACKCKAEHHARAGRVVKGLMHTLATAGRAQ